MRVERTVIVLIMAAAGAIGALMLHANMLDASLGNAAIPTGWSLFGLIIFLAALNLRKKLSMLPFGRMQNWVRIHVVGGLACLAVFWLHTESLWPTGVYEQALALLFYFVMITGVIGHIAQKTMPRRLSQTGGEVIYERIPAEIAAFREQAESIVVECVRESGSDTVSRYYLETIAWFFQKPRFYLSHLFGGRKGTAWVRTRFSIVRRYLDETEAGYLDQIQQIAFQKNAIDIQFATQDFMKRWLLFHVPVSAAMLTLAIWHVVLIYGYSQ